MPFSIPINQLIEHFNKAFIKAGLLNIEIADELKGKILMGEWILLTLENFETSLKALAILNNM